MKISDQEASRQMELLRPQLDAVLDFAAANQIHPSVILTLLSISLGSVIVVTVSKSDRAQAINAAANTIMQVLNNQLTDGQTIN